MPQAKELSERDRAILDFEALWPRQTGAKEQAIRRQFGLSVARYYQVLNALIDSREAVVHDPMLVRRLQRIREETVRSRTATRPAPAGGHDD